MITTKSSIHMSGYAEVIPSRAAQAIVQLWRGPLHFGVVVACLCSLMSMNLLPDELLKKLPGG